MPMRGLLITKRDRMGQDIPAQEYGDPRCTVCDLVGMTSQQVRWDDEERGYAAEGESFNAVENGVMLDEAVRDPSVVWRCNSTLESPAQSHWQPRVLMRLGARIHNGVTVYDEEIYAFPTGLDAWRGAGIGTNDLGEIIWNEDVHAVLLREKDA